jgi:general nucleoside transport system permease protein
VDFDTLLAILGIAIAAATPTIFAAIGAAIGERAGVINLSADGTMLLGGLAAFATVYHTQSLVLAFLAAALVGVLVALIVAYGAITLKQSQIAIGFVLALLCTDLSSFLGAPYQQEQANIVPQIAMPVLKDIPIIGPLFFRASLTVYASYVLIALASWYVYRTRAGLMLRAIGEQPNAAFARGSNVIALRYAYTLIGGALIGLAGAAFTLDLKAGWTHRHTAGYGWIALAIVIFGGWHPLRVAFGAYLFGILQSLSSYFQNVIEFLPTQVFPLLPFAFMILALVLTNSGLLDRLTAVLPLAVRRRVLRALRTPAPAALGKPFEQD